MHDTADTTPYTDTDTDNRHQTPCKPVLNSKVSKSVWTLVSAWLDVSLGLWGRVWDLPGCSYTSVLCTPQSIRAASKHRPRGSMTNQYRRAAWTVFTPPLGVGRGWPGGYPGGSWCVPGYHVGTILYLARPGLNIRT